MKLPLALSSSCVLTYAIMAAAATPDPANPTSYVIKFNAAYNASSAHAFLASKHTEFMVSMASDGDVSLQAADTSSPILLDSIRMGDSFFTMAGALDNQFVQLLHQDSAIEFIEADHIYKTTLVPSIPQEKRYVHKVASPNWGQARIRQRALGDLSVYDYADDAGADVDVFVLDSGVQADHPDFEGRASLSANLVQNEDDADFAGHGTHVAGKIAGKVYGVAKAANIRAVKILNKTGDGTLSTMLKGLSHVVQTARPGKAVVNLSLSGPPSKVMNAAIDRLVHEHNIPVFVSAGNSAGDACNFSPSSSPDVFVVGATDKTDRVARYSNTGPCVHIYAPGSDIKSTWIGGDGDEGPSAKSLDGTSMASPHVVGIAASLLSRQSFESPKQLYAALAELGTKNVLSFANTSAGSENINLLAFVDSE